MFWDVRNGSGSEHGNFMLPTNVLFGLKVSQSVFNLETHPIYRQISREILKLLVTISYFLKCWLAGGRALDWARINPVIKPWQRMRAWHQWHLPLSPRASHCIWSLTQKMSPSHDRTCSEYISAVSPALTLICKVTLAWWLAHIVSGMLGINQFDSPGGGGWCCYLIAPRVHFSFVVTGADTWVLSQQSEHFPSVNGYASILNKHDSAFLFATLYK